MTPAELVEMGLVDHKNGNLNSALAVYEKALKLNPDHPDALNLSASILHSQGDNFKALQRVNKAIALAKNEHFLNTRGMVFIGLGKYNEAIADLRASLKISKVLPEAHNNLSIAYRKTKDLKRAMSHIEEALRLRPDFLMAIVNRSLVYMTLGDNAKALEEIERVLALNPQLPVALATKAKILYAQGSADGAILWASQAWSQGYLDAEVAFVWAHALVFCNRLPEAAEVLNLLYQKDGLLKDLGPILAQDKFFNTFYRVCEYLAFVVGQKEKAIELYKKSVANAPDLASSLLVNLGTIYFALNAIDQAIKANQESIKFNPKQLWAHNNIGVCYIKQEKYPEAIQKFDDVLAIQPDFITSLGWLLKVKGHICDWTGYDALRQTVADAEKSGNTQPISAFTALATYDDPALLHYWAKLAANEIFGNIPPPLVINKQKSSIENRRVRIGYLSYDFRNHPVAHLTARLFEVHDREKFEVYAYSYGPDDGSQVRERIKGAVDCFVDLKEVSTYDAAKRIAEDGIDFLIDLTGNTLHNRSEIMGYRPAPLQAHWLGFIGTMGSSVYDYIIADDIILPESDEASFSEKVIRLSTGFHVMDDSRVIAPPQSRESYGLPATGFVFGSFCQTFKIQPEIFSTWMKILKAVPDSVLWLASGPGNALDNLKRETAAQGVDPARIIVAPRCSVEEYLSRFALIDLYLDTFPYTSGTIASDALHAGCPLLTMSGKTMVSKMAGSILTHAGLQELVAYNENDYCLKAIGYATNHHEFNRLKNILLQIRDTGAHFDTNGVAKELETNIIETISSTAHSQKTSE